jgi:YD repeat-containing protein
MPSKTVLALLDRLESDQTRSRYEAFTRLIRITDKPVTWAYDAWGRLIRLARAGDNHQRTMGVQLLANLAKSDPEARILRDLNELFRVTRDPMFVTARHSLLCLWKVGVVDARHLRLTVARLASRFHECGAEKHSTLVRYDILTVMKRIYDCSRDENLRSRALRLIELERDAKYRKKYAVVWRDDRQAHQQKGRRSSAPAGVRAIEYSRRRSRPPAGGRTP